MVRTMKGRLLDLVVGLDGKQRITVVVEGDNATVAFTSVLNADAYGARGTYRIAGTHYWELRDGAWIAV